ncbi:MAG: hypothetical protein AAF202_11205, partial [Pseudomonadota bacterium]
MGGIVIAAALALLSGAAQAQILVFEFLDEGLIEHADMVAQVACRENPEGCDIYQFPNLHEEGIKQEVQEFVGEFPVVNMSFGVTLRERPAFDYKYDYAKELEQWEEDNRILQNGFDFLTELVVNNPEVLFVAASGNGEDLGMAQGNGYNITDKKPMYPALIDAPNMVTVAAINQQPGFTVPVDEVFLTDYSNFSLFTVDVAAPVGPMRDGSFYEGTSFA